MELDISGARIFFTLPIDVPVLGPLRISETMVVSWIVMILITGLCIWLTHDLKEENISKEIQIPDTICCSTFCNQCGFQPDQSDRTSKPYSRPFY